ncbi:MAG TPA: 3-isopropylmalate dehydratase small subunit [Jatrophihabitantaceae bacterium]|nr:3-isopropylmalate dehydratase small subunit [Jatrophihabitantaceae bacterium]
MEKFTRHTGHAVPLRRSNVDTDQIIPAVYLKRVTRSGYEDGLFQAWRENERDFVLNQNRYSGATILVAGPDFGTGSSREHAVWALMDYGFKVVISPRFADIFRGNSLKAGLLTVVVPNSAVSLLSDAVEEDPSIDVTVDLVERTVSWADQNYRFEIDDYGRWRLLEGLDDIDVSLRHVDDIATYEKTRRPSLPAVS